MNLLAVDFGTARVGLAVGNSQVRVATPLPQVPARNRGLVLAEILRRVGEFGIERIVVGYPLNMDGSRGPACERVDQFVNFLEKKVGLPVSRFDERLSSFAAEEKGKDLERDFRKRKAFLDSVSAQEILQDYFARS